MQDQRGKRDSVRFTRAFLGHNMDLFTAEKGLRKSNQRLPCQTGLHCLTGGSLRYAPQNLRDRAVLLPITGATAHRYHGAPAPSGPFGHHKILHELRPHYTAASIYLGISPWDTVPLSIVIGGTSTYDQCAHPSSCWVTCHNLG